MRARQEAGGRRQEEVHLIILKKAVIYLPKRTWYQLEDLNQWLESH